ncbi:hypothetical protein P3G55_04895 [Leptospira sp. 96542]|nr:hypothetical protein [Leptospira sp. 96542]
MNETMLKELTREQSLSRKITFYAKILMISFQGTYLYLLFTSGYMASPLIVLINYMAIYTSFSGLIAYKFFEYPNWVLTLIRDKELSPFFSLEISEQKEIWEKSKLRFSFPDDPNLKTITSVLQLEDRYPWKTIGKIYFYKYLFIIFLGVIFLGSEYFQTGFQR